MQNYLKDLQGILTGAIVKGIKTVCEFMEVCKANNLNTNEEKKAYFTK